MNRRAKARLSLLVQSNHSATLYPALDGHVRTLVANSLPRPRRIKIASADRVKQTRQELRIPQPQFTAINDRLVSIENRENTTSLSPANRIVEISAFKPEQRILQRLEL